MATEVRTRTQLLRMTIPVITASWVVTQLLWPSPSTKPDAEARGLFPATIAPQQGFNQQTLFLVHADAAKAGTTSFRVTEPSQDGDRWVFVSCDTGTYDIAQGGGGVTGECVGHAQGVEGDHVGSTLTAKVVDHQAGRWGIAVYSTRRP